MIWFSGVDLNHFRDIGLRGPVRSHGTIQCDLVLIKTIQLRELVLLTDKQTGTTLNAFSWLGIHKLKTSSPLK